MIPTFAVEMENVLVPIIVPVTRDSLDLLVTFLYVLVSHLQTHLVCVIIMVLVLHQTHANAIADTMEIIVKFLIASLNWQMILLFVVEMELVLLQTSVTVIMDTLVHSVKFLFVSILKQVIHNHVVAMDPVTCETTAHALLDTLVVHVN